MHFASDQFQRAIKLVIIFFFVFSNIYILSYRYSFGGYFFKTNSSPMYINLIWNLKISHTNFTAPIVIHGMILNIISTNKCA